MKLLNPVIIHNIIRFMELINEERKKKGIKERKKGGQEGRKVGRKERQKESI